MMRSSHTDMIGRIDNSQVTNKEIYMMIDKPA